MLILQTHCPAPLPIKVVPKKRDGTQLTAPFLAKLGQFERVKNRRNVGCRLNIMSSDGVKSFNGPHFLKYAQDIRNETPFSSR
jgi:hypothetical protein